MKSFIVCIATLCLSIFWVCAQADSNSNNIQLAKPVPMSQPQMNPNQPIITFGVGEAYEPFSAVDSTGHVYGFTISFTELLCQEMNMQCVYKPMRFEDFFNAVKTGKVDAAAGAIAITAERQQDFAFTEPYLPSNAGILARVVKGEPQIKKMDPEVAKGKYFGFQVRSAFEYYLRDLFPNMLYKEFPTEEDLVAALAEGKVDFIVLDKPAADYWLNQPGQNFYMIPKPFSMHIGIMLNKNNPELLAKLNKAIMKVTKSQQFMNLISTFFPEPDMN